MRISERRTPDGGTVSVFTDITELKQRQAELEDAIRQTEAANQAKSAFLANMSHELRTPLNAIIGYSEMLQEEAEDLEQDQLHARPREDRERRPALLGLINDILDLSKIEAGKMDVYLETFDVAGSDRRGARDHRAAGREERQHARGPAAPTISARMRTDRTKLKQSLLNLLSNAGKFTEDGTADADRGAVRGRPPDGADSRCPTPASA